MKAFINWVSNNKGLFTGMCAGLATAILFLSIGFWATLLIGVCIGVGAFFGTHTEIFKRISNFFAALINKDE